MNNLISFLIGLKDNNKAKALYVNPQNFEDFVVDFVFNIGLQKIHNRVLVMSLDELSFCFSDNGESSRKVEAHHFVERELPSLIKR